MKLCEVWHWFGDKILGVCPEATGPARRHDWLVRPIIHNSNGTVGTPFGDPMDCTKCGAFGYSDPPSR
jgi:hypothetical protein